MDNLINVDELTKIYLKSNTTLSYYTGASIEISDDMVTVRRADGTVDTIFKSNIEYIRTFIREKETEETDPWQD